jgi:hypothetical protein
MFEDYGVPLLCKVFEPHYGVQLLIHVLLKDQLTFSLVHWGVVRLRVFEENT